MDTSAGDSEQATAHNIVESWHGEGMEPWVKEEANINVIELKKEVEWPPEEQEVANVGGEGKQNDAFVGGLQSWENIQIAPSLSLGPSCSERGTAEYASSNYEVDAVGLGGGYVIYQSQMSSGEGPTTTAVHPSASVTRPLQSHVETLVEEHFVTGLRDILVAQHDRQLDSLNLIRQEMTSLCQEVRELKTGLCQEVRELRTSLCQQLALSIQKLTDALTVSKEIQHQGAASDFNQVTIQKPDVRAASTEVAQTNPVEPFLTAPNTETVQSQELATTPLTGAI